MSKLSVRWVAAGVLVATVLVGCGGDDDDDDDMMMTDGGGMTADGATANAICGANALTAALAGAQSGSTVLLGDCSVQGSFTVPAGVTLKGTTGMSRIRGPFSPSGALPPTALTMTPGTSAVPTVLSDLDVESNGKAAIVAKSATSAGAVRIERVDVSSYFGIGIGIENLAAFHLQDVTLTGKIEHDNAALLDYFNAAPKPEDWSTFGLVLFNTAATLRNVSATKFAISGVTSFNGSLDWDGGSTSATASTGVWIDGPSATANLRNLTFCSTYQTVRPSYAALFNDGANITSTNLTFCDNERYGMVHTRSRGQHMNLKAMNNLDAAVWIDSSNNVELAGSQMTIMGNKFAGVVVRDSMNVTIRDGVIGASVTTPRAVGMTAISVGDGIQLVRAKQTTIRDLRLPQNQRVGLLVDVGAGTLADVTISGTVNVTTMTGANGALMQTATGVIAPNGVWDAAIVRDSNATTTDASTNTLKQIVTTGIISPDMHPLPTALRNIGLSGVVAP